MRLLQQDAAESDATDICWTQTLSKSVPVCRRPTHTQDRTHLRTALFSSLPRLDLDERLTLQNPDPAIER